MGKLVSNIGKTANERAAEARRCYKWVSDQGHESCGGCCNAIYCPMIQKGGGLLFWLNTTQAAFDPLRDAGTKLDDEGVQELVDNIGLLMDELWEKLDIKAQSV